jgi:1,4-dihydroxy-2-naphthoyl-CoA hydrolase
MSGQQNDAGGLSNAKVPPVPDELPYRLDRGFDRLLGLEMTEVGDGVMCGKVAVRDEIKQAAGLLHGGVYAAMAESLASIGTWLAVIEQGKMAMGLSNQTSFLRPATEGEVHARARAMHRGRTTWVWEVEMTDDKGRLCALTRVTVAVRDAPADMRPPGLQ